MTIERADGLPDDRVNCGQCTHFRPAGTFCASLRMVTWAALPLRCLSYVPNATKDPDPRTGRERWPTLSREIEETRALDNAHAAKRVKEPA